MSANKPLPGEIWRVDFGLAAKVRPAPILSDYPAEDELALLVVIPTQPPREAIVGNSLSPSRS
jgi:mRNA-degrading endonuclease toxin of MazEF toxin-antitoxin module